MTHYTLYDFNRLVRNLISEQLDPSYWIIAEIGQLNQYTNGHCYLELVEKEDQFIKAKTRGTIWANVFRELHSWFISQTGTELKPGMKILFNASLEFHEVYGLSLNIRDIDTNFTIGEREKKKQETIRQLESEGIIDMNKSLVLPPVIQRLAVISSPTAAGYEDFINQFQNNPYGYHAQLDLFPAVMQGDSAPSSIIESLHKIYEGSQSYDAIVLIRGGGSKMDLDCFDDYELCAHLAQFPIPLITGIGHERDQSIADLVAHTYLKTPTSVAEFLIAQMLSFESEIVDFHKKIKEHAQQVIYSELEATGELSFRFKISVKELLQRQFFQLESHINLLATQPANILGNHRTNLQHSQKLMEAYDPRSLLKKGFSITRVKGKVLKNQKLKPGDSIETETINQKITSTINHIK